MIQEQATITQTTLRVKTRVLSGNRVEFTAPGLAEGTNIELIVLPEEPTQATSPQQFGSMMDFIRSLKPIERTQEEWEALDRELREERDSWDS